MTPDKQKQKLAGQTSIAQKIFQYVPIAEEWTSSQIAQAMQIGTGARTDPKTLGGCLMSLADSGLVRVTGRGIYQRMPVSQPAPQQQKQEKETQDMTTPAPAPEIKPATSAIDLLAGIAQKLRDVAQDIDAAALVIEEGQSKNAADVAKLQMLKELFKS